MVTTPRGGLHCHSSDLADWQRDTSFIEIEPTPKLEPGEVKTFEQAITVDLCRERTYETSLIPTIPGTPFNCRYGQEDYNFEISPKFQDEDGKEEEEEERKCSSLSLQVEIECKTRDGVECRDYWRRQAGPEVESACERGEMWLVDIDYTYKFWNFAPEAALEIDLVRTWKGQNGFGSSYNLHPRLTKSKLRAGQTTKIKENMRVDACTAAVHTTKLKAEADTTEEGRKCRTSSGLEYEFRVGRPDTCTLEPSIRCIPPPPAVSCEGLIQGAAERCQGRPLSIEMLYQGGGCGQTNTSQAIPCFDFYGGPPTVEGMSSYIVVTDGKDPEIIYHSDNVEVGSTFRLSNNEERFDASLVSIIVYGSSDLSPSNVLQSMVFDSSCSQDLFLKDRLGALQIVEWHDEEQGLVSAYSNVTFDLYLSVPKDIQGNSLVMTEWSSTASWGKIYNQTDDVWGNVVVPGDTVESGFIAYLDLTRPPREYNVTLEIAGVTDRGTKCRGSASFLAARGLR